MAYFNDRPTNQITVVPPQIPNSEGGGIIIVLAALMLTLFVFNSFGINLTYFITIALHRINHTIHLDFGQLWTSAGLISLLLFMVLWGICNSIRAAISRYVLINLIIVGVDVILLTLFHVPLLKNLLHMFIGGKFF